MAAYYIDGEGTLCGPGGFACHLGEPEDCNWYRDGSKAVDRLNEQHATIQELLAACKLLVKAANDAWGHWDADNDHKVGKLLKAMGGGLKGYRTDLDAAHAAIRKAEGGSNG